MLPEMDEALRSTLIATVGSALVFLVVAFVIAFGIRLLRGRLSGGGQ